MTGEHGGKRQYFAPTAPDILRLMPQMLLSLDSVSATWAVIHEDDSISEFDSWNINPAEACAEAYLSIFSIS